VNKDQWRQIEKVFYSAMELPRNDRDDFVRQACAGDEELRSEVQALLDANRETENFLRAPAALPQDPPVFPQTRVKYCPRCREIYPVSLRVCRNDQEVLSLKDPYHLVGRTLMDKYRITALVGLGGMGAVYFAHHLGIDRPVALKILQPNVAIGSEYVTELFEREAKLAGRLTHENIVDVKDAGHTPDGIAYIAMEWLDGRTLDEELSDQGRFSFARSIEVIKQISAALREAHAKRVVHRDLKPGNIMLLGAPDGRDQVKVLDFGIGKVIKESTAGSSVSALVGTPQYASPEQLTIGARVDGRSDIYSLGVIFYRLLGGQLPFNCSSMGELLQMQLTAAPKSLRVIRPETPPAIENLINEMLSKEPSERPQNASEILKRIDRILGQLKIEELDGIGSERVSQAKTLLSAPKSARRTRYYLLYGLAIVAVILAGGYGLYRYRFNGGRNIHPVSEEKAPGAGLEPPSPSPTQINETERSSLVPPVNRVDIQANKRKADEHLQRARELYRHGEYQSALRECNESLKLNPRQVEARQFQRKINDIIKILNPH